MSPPSAAAAGPAATGGAAQDGGGDLPPTYYDRPLLKEPVWIWSVPAYFYAGGVSSGSALLAGVAQALDRDGHAALISRLRRTAAVTGWTGTGLLVHDLGRPSRFLNMLRVFRPTSAMSVGSWTLAAATGLSSGAALSDALARGRSGGWRRIGDACGAGAGALAPVLGTYTGVLLADTAVPLWRAARRGLPALFGASALASTTDVLDLAGLDGRDALVARRLGLVAKAAELAAAAAVQRQASAVPRVGQPLQHGVSGDLWRLSKRAVEASLAVSLVPVPRRWRRARRRLSATLGTAGALAGRFAVFQAGRASARDPRATFAEQRADGGGAPTGGGGAAAPA